MADVHLKRFANPAEKYLDYLAKETELRYPALHRHVKVLDRQTGTPRFSADADHIIPKSVWDLLMPGPLSLSSGGPFPVYSGVLSNLFWRDKQFNRRDDNLAIRLVKEANSATMNADQKQSWREKWITIFLLTKQDEGVLCTADVCDPRKLDELIGPTKHSNWMAYGAKAR
jgi:hypothetical protein